MFFLQMSGFPGSGKSTLSRQLAKHTGAIIIDHDVSKTALLKILDGTAISGKEIGRASYGTDWALIEFQLSKGESVIFDSPCLYAEMVEIGTQLALKYGAAYKYIECYLNDFTEINQRLANRKRLPSQIQSVDSESIFQRAVDSSQIPEGHRWIRVDSGTRLEKYIPLALAYLAEENEKETTMLKERLKAIKEMPVEELQNYSRPQRNRLVEEMLQHIGSTDSELRDELIYSVFFKLIVEKVLTDAELVAVLETCRDEDHLFHQISGSSTDAVFTRSFSSLVIALVLHQDKIRRFLSGEVLKITFAESLDYMEREQDIRGFVEGKGWAHSIAHGADLLAEAAGHPAFERDGAERCLAVVAGCLFKDGYYMNEEDDRLIFVLEALLEKGLSDHRLEQWTAGIFDRLKQYHENDGFSLEFFRVKTNVLNFAKTLYFRLSFIERSLTARRRIAENLKCWHQQLYSGAV